MGPRFSIFAAATLAGVVLASCQTAASSTATPPPGAVVVSAGELQFDQSSVDAPAGTAFTIWFENRSAVPHNARVADAAGATLATTEVFPGPSARSVDVPALAAGGYTLICDVHRGMTSTLVAD